MLDENVDGKLNTDVVRYTMESYVSSHKKHVNNDKHKEAVEKMKKLSQNNFEELLSDIVNEIHRRNNMEYEELLSPMRKKLTKLKDDKFRNLVFDILYVFNDKYYSKTNKNIEDEIENLSILIHRLKGEKEDVESTSREVIFERESKDAEVSEMKKLESQILNEDNELVKYSLFISFVKKKTSYKGESIGIEDTVIKHMEDFIGKKIEEENNNFEVIFNYKNMLKILDKSKYSKLDKYKIFKDNIMNIKSLNISSKTKKEIIDKEYLNILELIISKQYFFEEIGIKNIVYRLINLLTEIKNKHISNKTIDFKNKEDKVRLSYPEDESVKQDFNQFIEIVYEIINRSKKISYLNKNLVERLKKLTKEFEHKKNRSYEDVINITDNIKDLIENIGKM